MILHTNDTDCVTNDFLAFLGGSLDAVLSRTMI